MTKDKTEDNSGIRLLGDLQRLDIQPNDRFVLTVDRPLTPDHHRRIQEAWRLFVGGDDSALKGLLILDAGMKIGVISLPDGGDKPDTRQSA